MSGTPARHGSTWGLLYLLALPLALTAGCAGKTSPPLYKTPAIGSNCYAKALPTLGEGGLAWGATLSTARQKSLDNCMRYAGRSGGTPDTCKVVMAECRH